MLEQRAPRNPNGHQRPESAELSGTKVVTKLSVMQSKKRIRPTEPAHLQVSGSSTNDLEVASIERIG